jgi:hypothetical protein
MHRILPRILFIAILVLRTHSAAAGSQWPSDGAPVCTAPSSQLTPVAVADGAGGVIVAWYDFRGGNADIYAQRLLASGLPDPAWPAAGRALCTAAGWQHAPAIVPDGAGGAIVAWQDERDSSSDIYAQRVLASGTVDPAWPVNGRAVCAASDDQVYPAITSDGAGGAIVAWRDYRGGPDTDVYAQRVLASGAVDPAWPAGGRALCTAPWNQSAPAIAPDGAGGALVCWSDLRNEIDSDIYVQHVLASGAVDPAWPADGRALCVVAWNQSGPTIIGDGAGAAIVCWYDYRSGVDADIYAHRVLGGGVVDPSWPANGTALCTATGEQYSPVLAADGAGGALAAWYDYRAGVEADIYARRILSSGTVDPAWPADGRALCTAVGDQLTPTIVADGEGGAVASWMDYRNGASSDIYAQRVLGGGSLAPLWPVDGAALCTATGEQYSPSPVADGAGGVIVSWTDFRLGTYADIYAQRALLAGNVAVESAVPAKRFRLHPARPNPTRAGTTVRIELDEPEPVTVEVLDPAGRVVQTLIAGQVLPAGAHDLVWTGAAESGRGVAPGVYWIRAKAASASVARGVVIRP